MAKFRYLIERSNDQYYPFYLSCIDTEGQSTGGLGSHESVDVAKTEAQNVAAPDVIKWKEPPEEWKPDAICVSQYFNEMYESNPPD